MRYITIESDPNGANLRRYGNVWGWNKGSYSIKIFSSFIKFAVICEIIIFFAISQRKGVDFYTV
jgi:hypothetical protein